MRVVLVNLYFPSNRVKYMLSSYALMGYFQKNSTYSKQIEVIVENFSADEDVALILRQLAHLQPDVVGFSCYLWNIERVKSLVEHMGQAIKPPFILLGGPEITQPSADHKNDFADKNILLLLGEGEETFRRVIEYIYDHRHYPDGIKGTVLCGPSACDGTSQPAPEKPDKVDLSLMPRLYKDGIVPFEKYKGELVFLETQRGCKYKCRYCVYHGNLEGINAYPLQYAKDEIDYLLKEVNITSIRIIDADFVSDLPRAKEIIRHFIRLKAQGYVIKKIMLEFNYYDCDEDFLALLSQMKKELHVNQFGKLSLLDRVAYDSPALLDPYTVISGIGIQSLSNDALRAVARKPVDQGELNTFFYYCKKYNLALKLDMILGLPMETKDSYLAGLNQMVSYIEGTDHILQLALLQILPGSLLEHYAGKYALEYSRTAPYNIYQTGTMSCEEIRECAKLTGLLFRVINSPLRTAFYECLHVCPTQTPMSLIEAVRDQLAKRLSGDTCKFIREDSIDDDYWCGQIFQDLPAELILSIIKELPLSVC